MSVFTTPFSRHKRTAESSFFKRINNDGNHHLSGLERFYELFKYSARIKLLNIYLIVIIGIIVFTGIVFGIFEFWW